MKMRSPGSCHREACPGGLGRSIIQAFVLLALLSSVLCPLKLSAQAGGASAAEIKRITDRYTLTRNRISALLDLRQHPTALPVNPPNPFYQPPAEALAAENPVQNPSDLVVPEASDISDIDTLRKYSGTLKIGGLITRNGVPHLTINNTACKVGDIITVGNRDHPTYLKLLSLNPAEFTLGLNDATLVVPIKK